MESEFQAGFLGPVSLLSKPECRQLLRRLDSDRNVPPLDWPKGHAPTSEAFRSIATDERVLSRVAARLGPDLLLWGASLVRRWPSQKHAWHVDLESAGRPGKTVTVWIGLEHTSKASALRLVSHSHRLGKTIQELAAERQVSRLELSDEDVLALARECNPACELFEPALENGQALFFDGALWHGSRNTNRWFARTALILQYATPDVRIPEELAFQRWPFRYREEPLPACLLVRGRDTAGVNRILPPQATQEAGALPSLSNSIHTFELPLEGDGSGWRRHPFFRGSTPNLAALGCHASVLAPGRTPHPPHEHAEEELLIALDGQPELVILDDAGREVRHRLQRGSFVYYPAWRTHTIHNPGLEDASYLMYRWRSAPNRGANRLETRTFTLDLEPNASPDPEAKPFATRPVLHGPTLYLRTLHAHLSRLQPGAGYGAHADEHDIAILVLEGCVETLGREVPANSVIFYAAGQEHGLRNRGTLPATYLVFEFHGSPAVSAGRLGTLWSELRATPARHLPGRLARLARRVGRRVPGLGALRGRRQRKS